MYGNFHFHGFQNKDALPRLDNLAVFRLHTPDRRGGGRAQEGAARRYRLFSAGKRGCVVFCYRVELAALGPTPPIFRKSILLHSTKDRRFRSDAAEKFMVAMQLKFRRLDF